MVFGPEQYLGAFAWGARQYDEPANSSVADEQIAPTPDHC